MRKVGKRLPKSPTAVKRLSRGPIEDVPGQNKAVALRPSARKRKSFAPPAGSVPPQPFAPPVGAPMPV
jgi:hypothetical protein